MRILTCDIGTSSVKTACVTLPKLPRYSIKDLNIFFNAAINSITVDNLTTNIIKHDTFEALEWLKIIKRQFCVAGHLDAICISGNGPTLVSDNGRTLLWNVKDVPVNKDNNKDNLDLPIKNPLYNTNDNTNGNANDNISDNSSALIKESAKDTNNFSMFLPRVKIFKNLYQKDYNNTRYLLDSHEWVVWQLTGCAKMVLPERRFQKYYWNECEESNTNIAKLPSFTQPGVTAGAYRGVPVIYGVPDFIAAIIGCASVKPGNLCDRAGSSEGVNLCVTREIYANGVRTMPSVIPGLWYISIVIGDSGTRLFPFIDGVNNGALFLGDKNSSGYKTFYDLEIEVKKALDTLRTLAKNYGEPFDNKMVTTGGQAQDNNFIKEKSKILDIDLTPSICPYAELLGDAIIAQSGMAIL